ncbi:MAG: CAP domain-containing protein, partial [Smithella sp.]
MKEKEGANMNFGHGMFIIVFLGVLIVGGCAGTRSVGDETALLPLNEGVRDLTFLSQGEVGIVKEVNKARGPLQPLKVSMGLSFAAKERAVELGSNKQNSSTQDQEQLFARVRKFGTFNGSVAEIASHGWGERYVVEELMKGRSATKEKSELYFMDPKFTVMGVGCTPEAPLAPICVITLTSEFR